MNVTMNVIGAAGQWNVTLTKGGVAEVFSGVVDGRNDREMELIALIEGFDHIKEPGVVTVHTTSRVIADAFGKTENDKVIDGWLKNCVKRGYRRSDGNDLQNKKLWMQVVEGMKVVLPNKAVFVYDQPVRNSGFGGGKPTVAEPVVTKKLTAVELSKTISLPEFCEMVALLTDEQWKVVKKVRTSPRKATAVKA